MAEKMAEQMESTRGKTLAVQKANLTVALWGSLWVLPMAEKSVAPMVCSMAARKVVSMVAPLVAESAAWLAVMWVVLKVYKSVDAKAASSVVC
jgi:hypothetical protein